MKGIDTDKDEGKHKVVSETADKIFSTDLIVQLYPFETCCIGLLCQGRHF